MGKIVQQHDDKIALDQFHFPEARNCHIGIHIKRDRMLAMDTRNHSRAPEITVIVAGTNEPSNSNVLADSMIEGMKHVSPSVIVNKVRLKDVSIDHFNLDCYGASCPVDTLSNVESLIQTSDGVIIATPVWNFGVPAHLKNLIDRMGSFALDDQSRSLGTLNGKPFYLIFTGGMPKAAWPLIRKTISGLPYAIQYFGGSVVGTHFEGGCTLGRGVFGLVVDKHPESLRVMREKGQKFSLVVQRYAKTGKLPLKYILIKKFVRLVQTVKKKMGL